jgi:hypothetical protein
LGKTIEKEYGKNMHQITAFQCDYCKKINLSKSSMTRHEKRCHLNTENRSCATCKHLEIAEFDADTFLSEDTVGYHTYKGSWCAKKEIELSPLETKCDKWMQCPDGTTNGYRNK